MPAANTASVHGGVWPWWQHGSSVTTSVAPRADSPADSRATTSACASPKAVCHPSPRTRNSSSTTTAPTAGFGSTRPSPRTARAAARCITCSKVSNDSVMPLRPRRDGSCPGDQSWPGSQSDFSPPAPSPSPPSAAGSPGVHNPEAVTLPPSASHGGTMSTASTTACNSSRSCGTLLP